MSGDRRHPRADLARVQTRPLASRANLVHRDRFARVPEPGATVAALIDSLPTVEGRANAASTLRGLLRALATARGADRGRIWALGPHVIKHGLSPLIINLVDQHWISALATTGAGAVHDVEVALIGATSEEMSGEIAAGRFGMAAETGALIASAARLAVAEDLGFGQALGRRLEEVDAPHRELSILWQAWRWGVPATVHVAVGTDIVHMHPTMDGAATGAASQTDFRILAACMDTLAGGGVHVNVASMVVLPEVFLKALTVANNLRRGEGRGPIQGFLTVAVDQESRYRPLMNVVRRPTEGVGEGAELLGRIELLIPLIAQALVDGALA